jgi:hypothetical protein
MVLGYDDEYDEPIDRPRRRGLKQSGLGMASFALAILVGMAEFILLIVAGVMEAETPGGLDEDAPASVVLGILLLGGMVMSFVGIALAIGGFIQRERSKVFPILGLVFNGVIILGLIGIIIIGFFSS